MMRRVLATSILVGALIASTVGCLSLTNGAGYDRHDNPDCCSITFSAEATPWMQDAIRNGGDPSIAVQITDWPEAQDVWSWIAGHDLEGVRALILSFRSDQRLWFGWSTGGCGSTCYVVGVVG